MTAGLRRGSVAWAALDPVRGREQAGHRPLLVIASDQYLDLVTTLVIGVPVTSVDYGWPNHVALVGATGLDRPSWAMTEQPRTLSRERITTVAGEVDAVTMAKVDLWLRDFLGF